MEDIYYIFCERPFSHNGSHNGKKLKEYKKQLSQDFFANFSNLYSNPFCRTNSVNVMTEILYFESVKYQKTDIDNLSKPIIDAFKGVLYDDDNQVVKRVATKINTFDYSGDSLDVTDLPPTIVNLYLLIL